jgi:hypothetical protein
MTLWCFSCNGHCPELLGTDTRSGSCPEWTGEASLQVERTQETSLGTLIILPRSSHSHQSSPALRSGVKCLATTVRQQLSVPDLRDHLLQRQPAQLSPVLLTCVKAPHRPWGKAIIPHTPGTDLGVLEVPVACLLTERIVASICTLVLQTCWFGFFCFCFFFSLSLSLQKSSVIHLKKRD